MAAPESEIEQALDEAAERAFIKRLIAAQYDENIHRPNPNGQFPSCRPELGPWPPGYQPKCDKCGNLYVLGSRKPCPSARPEDRWGPDVDP